MSRRIIPLSAVALALLAAPPLAQPSAAQWTAITEQFYWPAEHNWRFRRDYPAADRLFNAFDYGHAILYELLWTKPDAPVSLLEEGEFDFLTKKLLVSPPRVPLVEEAIEPMYARLAPEAKAMFEWAHVLHRQLYDVLADERLSRAEKDAEIARIVRYYKSRPDLAFSSRPKSMELMEGQPYSLAFRKRYPKFNGLIWAYHWLQVGLYEPLVTGASADERQTGVLAAVARFRQMVERAPDGFPRYMPMTAAIAPEFSRRYPEAAIIFDNLHSMHDVISDILANPQVPRGRKRGEILLAAQRFRDDTSYIMTEQAWRDMARDMGLENQGGPAVGLLRPPPTPSVAAGAAVPHAGHGGMAPESAVPHADSAAAHHEEGMHGRMMQLHMRMMADSVIRRRIMADTAMHRMMMEMMQQMPPEHRAHMEAMMHTPPATPAPRDPHAGHHP
ncbi:MAG TPA: hypothetical protein VFS05_10785 [Gemmatimonadaceae bacterium]|nr:hypothetical protein [Gemmatimonadaceae bacterium]